MYDLNISVPNITAQKYTVDNRFLLLKNYLCELNETLSFALSDRTDTQIRVTRKEIEEKSETSASHVMELKEKSLKRFNELKEQILRTADEIQVYCNSQIEQSEEEIFSAVERNCVSKSEYGEYKNQVNTALSQTATDISLISENTDDVKNDLENFKNSARSELSVQAEAIISNVEETFQSKNEAQELENRVVSQITQTKSDITENFSNEISLISQDISSVGGTVNDLISNLDVYIRRGQLEENVYGIEIGRSDSNIKARFTNDRLSFYQGMSEVAYISGSSLYITNADVLDYLRIGNSSQGYFLFDTTPNGLEVRWIDGN